MELFINVCVLYDYKIGLTVICFILWYSTKKTLARLNVSVAQPELISKKGFHSVMEF